MHACIRIDDTCKLIITDFQTSSDDYCVVSSSVQATFKSRDCSRDKHSRVVLQSLI